MRWTVRKIILLFSLLMLVGVLISVQSAQLEDETQPTASETGTVVVTVVEETPSEVATEPVEIAPPRIIALWQLPDMQPQVPGMQYGTLTDPGQHDDDMLREGIQIAQLPDGEQETRSLEYWLVVGAGGGVQSLATLDLSVYGPDAQLPEVLQVEERGCPEPGAVWEALESALDTRQVSVEAVELLAACDANEHVIYRAVGNLPPGEPPGQYRVVAQVSDQLGGRANGGSAFEVLATESPAETATPEPAPDPTGEPTVVADPTAAATPTATIVLAPTEVSTPTASALPATIAAPSPTPEPTPTTVSLPSPTTTATPTAEPLPTATSTPMPTATPTPIPTLTPTTEPTATAIPTAVPTMTPTLMPTATAPTLPIKPTTMALTTPTPAATSTPVATAVPTSTPVPTPEPTAPAAPVPPEVLALWQLPDMQATSPSIQYGTAGDEQQHDDDMLQAGVQIAPNLDDQPEPRGLEHWLVARVDGGSERIALAQVTLYDPAGNLWAELQLEPAGCEDLPVPLAVAGATGQVPEGVAGQLAICDPTSLAIFRVAGALPVTAPAGTYRVAGLVLDDNGNASSSTSRFESLPVLGLEVSSNRVSFGEISPGDWHQATSQYSVRNIGNVGGFITIEFGSMVGNSSGGVISDFGAASDAEELMSIVSGQPACFSQQLASNERRDLALFVRPGAVPADEYAGRLNISIRMSCAS